MWGREGQASLRPRWALVVRGVLGRRTAGRAKTREEGTGKSHTESSKCRTSLRGAFPRGERAPRPRPEKVPIKINLACKGKYSSIPSTPLRTAEVRPAPPSLLITYRGTSWLSRGRRTVQRRAGPFHRTTSIFAARSRHQDSTLELRLVLTHFAGLVSGFAAEFSSTSHEGRAHESPPRL